MKIKIILLSIISALFFACGSPKPKDSNGKNDKSNEKISKTDQNHDGHKHGSDCTHDHSVESHSHDAEGHEHGPDCTHDHSAESHSHDAEGHEHGPDCTHDHSAESHSHDAEGHEHGPDCTHDHSAESHSHDAEGHDHSTEGHSHDADEHGPDCTHDHGSEAAEAVSEIVMSPQQAKQLGLRFQKIAPKQFSGSIRTSGIIEATPGDDAAIVATTTGIVNFGGRKIVEGMEVNRGGVILSINSSTLTDDNLRARIIEADANFKKAQSEIIRVEKLYKDKLVTTQTMEEAKFAEVTARQTYSTLSRNTGSGGKSLSSPISGYVTSLFVRDGDYVAQGDLIATVSNSRTVVLKADLPARYFDMANVIASANFTTTYNKKTYDIADMNGRKLATARSASNYSLPIRFELENRAGFIAGSVVDVYLKTLSRSNVIAIPVAALTEEQGAFYVYVQLDEECYEKRNVRLGQSNGLETEVISGLRSGETIVSKGAYFVRLASMSGEIPHGHTH